MAKKVLGVRLEVDLIDRFDAFLEAEGAERAEVIAELLTLLVDGRLAVIDTDEVVLVAHNPTFPGDLP